MGNAVGAEGSPEPAVNPTDLLRKFKECQRIVLAAANNIVADLSTDTSEPLVSPNSVEGSELQKLIKCEGTLLNAAKNIVNVLSVAHLTTESDAISPQHDDDTQNRDSGNASDGDTTDHGQHEHRRKDFDQMSNEPVSLSENASNDSSGDADDVDMERNDPSVSVKGKILCDSKSSQHFDTVIHGTNNNQSETNGTIYQDEDSLLDNESLSGSIIGDEDIDDLLMNFEDRLSKSQDHENPDKESSVETESSDEELSSNSIMSKPTGLNDKAETSSESSSSESESESADSDETETYYDDILEKHLALSCNDIQTIDKVQSDNNDNISLENSTNKIDTEMKREREETSPSRETKRCKIDTSNNNEYEELDVTSIEEPEAPLGLDVSSIEEPEAPLGLDVSSTEEPEAPLGLHVSSTEEPEAPLGLHVSSTEEPEAPLGLHVSSTEEPEAPLGLDESRIEEPEAPLGLHVSSTEEPEAPLGLDASRIEEPEAPLGLHVSSTEEPEAPLGLHVSRIEEPESPLRLDESSIEEPEVPLGLDMSSIEEPETPLGLDESRIEEPEAPQGLDESSTEEPEASLGLHRSSIEEPEAPLGLDVTSIEEPEVPLGLDVSSIEEPEAPLGLDDSRIEEPESPLRLDESRIEEPEASPRSDASRTEEPEAPPGPDASRIEEPEELIDASEESEVEGYYEDEDGELSYGRFRPSMFGTKVHFASTPGPAFQPSSKIKNEDDTKKRRIFRRRKKREILDEDSLVLTTIKAIDDENRRTERIEKRRKEYGIKDLNDDETNLRLAELVLDYDPVTKAPLIKVDPGLLAQLMPHQVNGVMFMWEACFESVEQIKVNKLGTGCILAHCMGLGKTLQVVTLVHTLFNNAELTGVKRVLVVCPKSTALNWAAELNRWLEKTQWKCQINIHEITTLNDVQSRVEVLAQWVQQGGVCVIGYAMFRQLVMPPKKKESKEPQEQYVLDPWVKAALLDTGPDLVVCDEGHGLKNAETGVAQALAQVRTRRRIMLTGTPLQNNLKEYYQMVNFVKPKLLGNKDEFYNRFEVPIYNGQFQDSSKKEINEMKRQAHVLHKLLNPTIQRKHYSMLTKKTNPTSFLPPKVEFALFIELTPLQRTLYQSFLNGFEANGRKYRLFRDYQTLLRIYNHPLALKDHKNCEEKRMKKEKRNQNDAETLTPDLPLDWFEDDVQGTKLEVVELSHKLSLLFQILWHCEKRGEKLLVFSQSLYVLNVIEFFLKAQNEERIKSNSNFSGWTPNVDYFRLDGAAKAEAREQSCRMFNSDEPNARLFLISTRAGGLGINLKAATRVVLFDVSWNPSHDVQSIFRVFRIGQNKPCFIYRFIAIGTIEDKIYKRQVTKLSVAKRVVDENQVQRHFSVEQLTQLYQLEPQREKVPQQCDSDSLLDTLLKTNDSIIEYSLHDSLFDDKEEEKLSEKERLEAWEKYEEEQRGAIEPVQQHILDLQSEPSANNDRDSEINKDASTSGASNAAAEKKKKQRRDSLPPNPSAGDLSAKIKPNDKDNSINQVASISGTNIAATNIKKTELPLNNPSNRVSTEPWVPIITDSMKHQGAFASGIQEKEPLSKIFSNGDSTPQPVPIDTGRINQGTSTSGIINKTKVKRKQKNNPPSTNPPNGDSTPQPVPIDFRINQGAWMSGIINEAKVKRKQKNSLPLTNPPNGYSTPQPVPIDFRINQGASTSGIINKATVKRKQKNNPPSTNPRNRASTPQTVPIDFRINQGASTSGIINKTKVKRKQKNNPPSKNLPNGFSTPQPVPIDIYGRINPSAWSSGITKKAKVTRKQKINPPSMNPLNAFLTPKTIPKVKTNRINSGVSTSGTSNTPAKMRKEQKEEIKLLLQKLMPKLPETKLKNLLPKLVKASTEALGILKNMANLKSIMQRKFDLTPNNQDWLIQNKINYLELQKMFHTKYADVSFEKYPELRVLRQEYTEYFAKWFAKAFNSFRSLEF